MKITKEKLIKIIEEEIALVAVESADLKNVLSEQYVVGRWLDSHQNGGPGYVIKDVIRSNGVRDVGLVGSVMSADELKDTFGQNVKVYANFDDIPKKVRARWGE